METNSGSKKMVHAVNGHTLVPPFPENTKLAMFGMGCFWGTERTFWDLEGVYSTQVGHTAGHVNNPTYDQVCKGDTGHAEVVRVVYEPDKISYKTLLKKFWESHNPTQGNRQGADHGTQYRSGIYCYDDEQKKMAEESMKIFQQELEKNNYGKITTEIAKATEFYITEEYHQQHLFRNPDGCCEVQPTGVRYPIE